MPIDHGLASKHFTLQPLANGLYACINRPGGAAYSNAGIINLGDRTLVVDAFNSLAAGHDLRQTAEALFERPVETIILTHPHSDHWIGASAFDASTTLLASPTTRQVCLEWGAQIMEDFQNPAEWEEWLREMEKQLQEETDVRVRAGLENSIQSTRYALAEMADFQPRYADQSFEDALTFQGSHRNAELRSLGRGHSEEDAVLLLPQDNIAFIGDIGFFNSQPYLGFCDIDLYREQLLFFQQADYQVLVPGHGPVGGKDDLTLQLAYMDVMEELIGEVAQRGGSYEEALQISLPEPFDQWLHGGMARFEVNVRYLFARFGGEVPETA
ncbi:MAG TPA: MBL fold metallo-hydrolase [Anaerolineales bacterium]|nr:MBL fold metallo-hydrolase [Anaerolineales bacterium]